MPKESCLPPRPTLFENRLPESDPKAAEVSTAVRETVKRSLKKHGQMNLGFLERKIRIPYGFFERVKNQINKVLGGNSFRYELYERNQVLILEEKDDEPDPGDKTWTTKDEWRAFSENQAKKRNGR